MPYFMFRATTPYCGEELEDYIEIPEDELDSVDEICAQLAVDVAEMFWNEEEEDEDGEPVDHSGLSWNEYSNECYCDAVEISKEDFDKYTK